MDRKMQALTLVQQNMNEQLQHKILKYEKRAVKFTWEQNGDGFIVSFGRGMNFAQTSADYDTIQLNVVCGGTGSSSLKIRALLPDLKLPLNVVRLIFHISSFMIEYHTLLKHTMILYPVYPNRERMTNVSTKEMVKLITEIHAEYAFNITCTHDQ
jgi:hypothetical protein